MTCEKCIYAELTLRLLRQWRSSFGREGPSKELLDQTDAALKENRNEQTTATHHSIAQPDAQGHEGLEPQSQAGVAIASDRGRQAEVDVALNGPVGVALGADGRCLACGGWPKPTVAVDWEAKFHAHTEAVKAWTQELAPYLGLDGEGPYKPADFIKAASEIRQGWSDMQDALGRWHGYVRDVCEALGMAAFPMPQARAEMLRRARERVQGEGLSLDLTHDSNLKGVTWGPAVPEGWQLVPKMATVPMLYAIGDLRKRGQWAFANSEVWRDMLAAAPQPPIEARPERGFTLPAKTCRLQRVGDDRWWCDCGFTACMDARPKCPRKRESATGGSK